MIPRLDERLDPWLDLVRDAVVRGDSFPGDLVRAALHDTFGVHVMGAWSEEPTRSVGRDTAVPTWPTMEIEPHWLDGGYMRHPVSRWYTVSPDLAPITIDRVPTALVSVAERREVQEALIPPSVRQQLVIMYHRSSQHRRLFVLGKSGTDFTETELALARQLQPLFALMDRQSAALGPVAGDGLADELGVTGRQLAVLELLDQGLTAAAIGGRLGISPRTVEVHLRRAYQALGVRDRLLAVRVYREARDRARRRT